MWRIFKDLARMAVCSHLHYLLNKYVNWFFLTDLSSCPVSVISAISAKYKVTFALSGELISVIGMVMGYVISYRLSSGYERYSTARDAWTTMMRTIRSMSRLVWIHIPLRLTFDSKRSRDTAIAEARQVMKEKRMALDLMEGYDFCIQMQARVHI